ncbi:hypothetical protein D3C79_627780 [compost metagenome]
MGVLALQHGALEPGVQAFEVGGALGHALFQFLAAARLEVDAVDVVAAPLHHQAGQQHQHQQGASADGHHGLHRTVDQHAWGEDADLPAGFLDVAGLADPGVLVEHQRLRGLGRVGLDGDDGLALGLGQRAGRAEAPVGPRGQDDHAIVVGQQQLLGGAAPQGFGVVEVDLDHQYANDAVTVMHGGGKEVAALGRRGALAEEAPQAAGHGFVEVGAEGEVAADEAVALVPVGGGQGVAADVHQVHHLGASLLDDVLEQAVGVCHRFQAERVGQHPAQRRQVAENLRQGFVAVQGTEQVGDVQVEGLAVLRGQFFLVVTFGQVMQGPQ